MNMRRKTGTDPFSSPYVFEGFDDSSNESRFCAHHTILEAAPKLFAESTKLYSTLLRSVTLPYHVGHVVVQFLYTGTYKDLSSEGTTQDQDVLKLTTAIGVYKTSRKYELSQLEELSKGRIRSLCDHSNLPALVDILEETYSSYGQDDKWLPEFVASQLQGFCETLSSEKADEYAEKTSDFTSTSLVKIIMHRMIILQQEIVAARNQNLPSGLSQSENHHGEDALDDTSAQAESILGVSDVHGSHPQSLGSKEEKESPSGLPASGWGDEEEERELEQLAAKKARRGRLAKARDRERYNELMELAKSRDKEGIDIE